MSMLTIAAVGDVILDEPDPDSFLRPSARVLTGADLAIAQVDVPHSTSTTTAALDIPAPPADPAHVAALARAGFGIITLAGNHVFDAGVQGVVDTIDGVRAAGMVPTGSGRNLSEALTPAIVDRGGRRVGVLSFNCVGPRESWATPSKPGAAYVKVLTHFEVTGPTSGPPTVYSFCDPVSLAAMEKAISDLAREVDVVIVALHKGVGHVPSQIAEYEFEISHAAIDAGAHAVLAHHAHIMRGIELYRSRPIFHGLGNFVTVTRALALTGSSSEERLAWARRRRSLFGFTPDPAMPTYPFHPDSRNTIIAMLRVDDAGDVAASFVPCWIDDDAIPQPLGRDIDGEQVAAYVESITRDAGLSTPFRWDGAEVRVGD